MAQQLTATMKAALESFAEATKPHGMGLYRSQLPSARQATIDALRRRGYIEPTGYDKADLRWRYIITTAGLKALGTPTLGDG